ncbi:hypothetical protein BDV28DRAFT_150170 [Aspergillus coremiiformis]|uniref:Uncharacterized protein n=1 Tax=Aspergillus coremiiformis TaxID=138285 RepID=A0A5N6Z0P9_9EURO|nr:hypothetical protein BDV28DRAFT_150170 [Aspergillus coremiiformis]
MKITAISLLILHVLSASPVDAVPPARTLLHPTLQRLKYEIGCRELGEPCLMEFIERPTGQIPDITKTARCDGVRQSKLFQ